MEPWKACLHVEVLQPWTNFGAAYGTPGTCYCDIAGCSRCGCFVPGCTNKMRRLLRLRLVAVCDPGVAARGVPMRMPVLAASMTSESILQLTFSVTASDVLSLVLASLDESTIMSPGTSSLTLKKLLAETAGDEVGECPRHVPPLLRPPLS